MSPNVLINIGINPRPQCPSYYNIFFDKIIHLCPGNRPGKRSELNKNEILINIDGRGFNLPSYGLCQKLENTYIEIALESGLRYGNLLIPNDCYIIGRVCDIHHLDNPLSSIVDYTRHLNFKCLVFSSCPHYISLFESICKCYYLPTDIEFNHWHFYENKNNWEKRSNSIHIDGNLLSKYHFSRSYLYNWLLAYGQNKPEIGLVKSLNRDEWIKKLKNTQVVVQYGLNGNAHPPFLTAISSGALPLIDSSSARSIERSLNVNLASITYKSPMDLLEKLRIPNTQLYNQTNLNQISRHIYNYFNAEIAGWFSTLRLKENSSENPKTVSQQEFALSSDDIEVFYALQYFQEIWRRMSYLSKGECPRISLVNTQNDKKTQTDPKHNQELVEAICQKISAIWGIKSFDANDSKQRNYLDLSLKEVMIRTNNINTISKDYFKYNYTICDFSYSSKIKLTSPLFNQLAKDTPNATIM